MSITLFYNVAFGQEKKIEEKLPYYEIPVITQKYTAGSVAARLIDGLGFRFYWATEGLREEDLNFKPSKDAKTTIEKVTHIYNMSEMIKNGALKKITQSSQSPVLSFNEMRQKTLENLKIASENLINLNDDELVNCALKIQQGEKLTEYPFWNFINGPISDCIWHAGQIVSFRRQSGNPFSSKVNLLTGTVNK